MAHIFETIFPNLRSGNYEITSERSPSYNCIAWAAGRTDRWWWPSPPPFSYWPENVPRKESIQSFVLAFKELGYEPCENVRLEPGYEKVAIYADADRIPTHMARQLASGDWTSKLGQLEDIRHSTLEEIEGTAYGRAVQILRRPISVDK